MVYRIALKSKRVVFVGFYSVKYSVSPLLVVVDLLLRKQ